MQGGRPVSRRWFLALASATAGGAILAACGGSSTAPTATAAAPQGTATRVPTAAPVGVGATSPAAAASGTAPTAAASQASAVASVAPTAQAAAGKPGGTKILRVGVAGDLTQLYPALLNNQTDYQVSETIFNYIGRHTRAIASK